MEEQYKKETAPYRNGMTLIEGLLGEEIERLEGRSISTEHGTAIRSLIQSYKVVDRERWFNWIFTYNLRELLTTNVAKDALRDHIEEKGGGLPPGLDLTQVYRISIRKPNE